MTENECLENIIKFCNKEKKKARWFDFKLHYISIEKIRLLKDYEKDANLSLPPELIFENARVGYYGIEFNNLLYKWSDICCLVIKTDTFPDEYEYNFIDGTRRTNKYIVFSLFNGEILQIKAAKGSRFSNLLGHFVEQYKLGIGK